MTIYFNLEILLLFMFLIFHIPSIITFLMSAIVSVFTVFVALFKISIDDGGGE